MSRSELLQQLNSEHVSVAERMRAFSSSMIDFSLDALAVSQTQQAVLNHVLMAMFMEPQRIYFNRGTLADYAEEFRAELSQQFSTNSEKRFPIWYRENWVKGNKELLRTRVLDKNVDHFIEAWYGVAGQKTDPNWNALEEAHRVIQLDRNQPVYPLYGNLYRGFHISAVECSLEDFVGNGTDIKPYLLQ